MKYKFTTNKFSKDQLDLMVLWGVKVTYQSATSNCENLISWCQDNRVVRMMQPFFKSAIDGKICYFTTVKNKHYIWIREKNENIQINNQIG